MDSHKNWARCTDGRLGPGDEDIRANVQSSRAIRGPVDVEAVKVGPRHAQEQIDEVLEAGCSLFCGCIGHVGWIASLSLLG